MATEPEYEPCRCVLNRLRSSQPKILSQYHNIWHSIYAASRETKRSIENFAERVSTDGLTVRCGLVSSDHFGTESGRLVVRFANISEHWRQSSAERQQRRQTVAEDHHQMYDRQCHRRLAHSTHKTFASVNRKNRFS